MRRFFSVWCLCVASAACSQEPRAARATSSVGPASLRAPDEVIVDLSARGEAIVGRVLPVPPQSDADRVLTMRWLTSAGSRRWRYADTPAVEARFVPGGDAVLVITREHALVRLDGPDAVPVTLDRSVYGPLSLDALGRTVAYTRGEAPALEVARAEIATGHTVALAPELVPAWCPALSPDGTEVLVVASPDGTPGFYRVRDGARPERWGVPAETPLPTGPSAPVIFGDAVVYESDGALRALGLDGSPRRTFVGMSLAVHVTGASSLIAHDAQHHAMRLTARDFEVSR